MLTDEWTENQMPTSHPATCRCNKNRNLAGQTLMTDGQNRWIDEKSDAYMYIKSTCLTFTTLLANSEDDKLVIFLFFPENRI